MVNLVFIIPVYFYQGKYITTIDNKTLFPAKRTEQYTYVSNKIKQQYVLINNTYSSYIGSTYNYNVKDKWQKSYFNNRKIILSILENNDYETLLKDLSNDTVVYCFTSFLLYQMLALSYPSTIILLPLPINTIPDDMTYLPSSLIEQRQLAVKNHPLRCRLTSYTDLDSQYHLLAYQLQLTKSKNYTIICNIAENFPILRCNKVPFNNIIKEVLHIITHNYQDLHQVYQLFSATVKYNINDNYLDCIVYASNNTLYDVAHMIASCALLQYILAISNNYTPRLLTVMGDVLQTPEKILKNVYDPLPIIVIPVKPLSEYTAQDIILYNY